MVIEFDSSLPAHIACSWRDPATRRWCEVEITGEFLEWVTFREVKPLSSPLMPIPKLADIADVPNAFLDVWGVVVRMGDIEKAVKDYRRHTGGFEGRSEVSR